MKPRIINNKNKNKLVLLLSDFRCSLRGFVAVIFCVVVSLWCFSWKAFWNNRTSRSSSFTTNTNNNHLPSSAGAATSHCVPWEVNLDDWWTHHPDWEPGLENDTHYCFQKIQDVEKASFLTNLYHIQHGHNRPPGADYCSNVTVKHMFQSGWGADMITIADALEYAAHHGTPVQIDESESWHYAIPKKNIQSSTGERKAACALENMYCYFLRLTPCFSDQTQKAIPNPQTYFYNVEKLMLEKRYRWYIDYIVRPQTWLRKRVYDFLKGPQAPQIHTPCTVMHVRRNDVVMHGVQARKYHAIAEYLNATITTTNNNNNNNNHHTTTIRPNILLLTDDQNAIGEATTQFPQYHWMYINRPRFQGMGHWEHQTPSDDPVLEVVILLAIFQLVQYCDQILLSTGRFSEYLYHEMKRSQASIDYVNIDQGKDFYKEIANRQNQASVAISKEYKRDRQT